MDRLCTSRQRLIFKIIFAPNEQQLYARTPPKDNVDQVKIVEVSLLASQFRGTGFDSRQRSTCARLIEIADWYQFLAGVEDTFFRPDR
jgi:hypothetical protein